MGESYWPGLRGVVDVFLNLVSESGGMGRQAMKVSLSGSLRQLRCMEYSSGRERSSEAVASWRSCSVISKMDLCRCSEVKGCLIYWIFHPFMVGCYVGYAIWYEENSIC